MAAFRRITSPGDVVGMQRQAAAAAAAALVAQCVNPIQHKHELSNAQQLTTFTKNGSRGRKNETIFFWKPLNFSKLKKKQKIRTKMRRYSILTHDSDSIISSH